MARKQKRSPGLSITKGRLGIDCYFYTTPKRKKLKQAIPILKKDDGIIAIGSVVVLENETGSVTFEILGSNETNPLKGRISYLSPLGIVLIGRAVGESVSVATANGQITYRVVEVR